jgi:hypothetical protein
MASVLTIWKGRRVEADAREMLAFTCLPRQTAAWWDDLAKRRLAKTSRQLSVESAHLIWEGRDAR